MNVTPTSGAYTQDGAEKIRGDADTWPTVDHFDEVLGGDPVTITTGDGEVLARYLPEALPADLRDRALDAVHSLAEPGGPTIRFKKEQDGTTAGGMIHLDTRRGSAAPITPGEPLAELMKFCSSIYGDELPGPAHRQARAGKAAKDPDTFIDGTTFQILTINYNHPTYYHRDSEAEPEFYNIMPVIREGDYSGGITVLPETGYGIDMGDRDILIFRAPLLHGNTEIDYADGGRLANTRVSFTPYWRCEEPFSEILEGPTA